MNYCANCGQKLDTSSKFCPNCGKGTETGSPENATPAGGKKRSGKGRLILIVIIIAALIAGLFFLYKHFLSGPAKMTAEYKQPAKENIIRLENGGLAPANMLGIMLKEGFGKSDAQDAADIIKGRIVGEIELSGVYQIEFDGKSKTDLYSALEKIRKSDKVELAFPDGAMHVDGAENSSCNPFDDPFYDGDYGNWHKMINLKQAWDIIKASGIKLNDVTVGVLDEKVNYGSEEISTGDRHVVPVNRSDMEENGKLTHGTMVTEVIAANDKNGGMTGVASILGDNLQVNTMSGNDFGTIEINDADKDPNDISQVEFPNGKTYTMEAMKNLQNQIDKGATVINCSFSNHLHNYTAGENAGFSLLFKRFLEKAQKKYPNVIFVGTAGNDMNTQLNDNKIWGKKTDNLVTVGAVDKDMKKTSYTNLASKNGTNEVTVVACGDIKMENGKISSGTSFSAPQVTGLIAILRSINPKLTPAEIKKILTETSKDVSGGQNFQMNLIQADDAVIKAIESATGKKLDKKKLLSMM
ncbi:MAG: S8 family serine peptidase, partial [Bacteroidetes bacterium]|nr:S8 family serine peptidase [Bacteroidota bacterium]